MAGEKTVNRQLSMLGINVSHMLNDGYTDLLNPILAVIALDLSFSLTMISSLLTVMNVFNFMFKVPSGWFLDVTRRYRFVLILGLVLQAGGFVVFGLLSNYWLMTVTMAVIGIGWSVYHPACFSFIAALFSERRRGLITAFTNMAGTIGSMIFVALIGVLTQRYSWRIGVESIAIAGVLIAVGIFFTLPGELPEEVQCSAKKHYRFLDLLSAIIQNKALLLNCLMGGFRGIAHRGITVFIPLLFASIYNFNTAEVGILYALMIATGIFGQFMAGYLSDRMGTAKVLLWALFLAAVTTVLIPLAGSTVVAVILVAILGIWNYAVRPLIWNFTTIHASPESVGLAVAVVDMSNQLLAAFSPVMGALATGIIGIQGAMYFYAAVFMAAGMVAIYMRRVENNLIQGG